MSVLWYFWSKYYFFTLILSKNDYILEFLYSNLSVDTQMDVFRQTIFGNARIRKQTTCYWVNTYISNTYFKTLKFTLDYTIIISFHNIIWKRKQAKLPLWISGVIFIFYILTVCQV